MEIDTSNSNISLELQEGYKPSKSYLRLTRRQLAFLATYGIYNIFRGALVLIVGPLYPPEAEKREISQSTIGFVIGSYDFATFLASLFYGKYFIPKFGPQRVIIFSTFNTTLAAILFGYIVGSKSYSLMLLYPLPPNMFPILESTQNMWPWLIQLEVAPISRYMFGRRRIWDKVIWGCLGFIKNKTWFTVLSFLIRLLGGAGDAGFYPSAFTIFVYEFPDLVSTTIGAFEVFFGIGAILGPIVCSPLQESIGYEWTYFAVGGCLLLSSILILMVTPKVKERPAEISFEKSHYGFFHLFKIPAIYFAIYCLFSTAASIGFITGTLEAHLQQFDLTSLQLGSIFSVSTVIYTVCSPIWGQISDRLQPNKTFLIASGSIFIGIGFIFLGPLRFISEDDLLWSTLFGLSLHGIGIGSAIMVFFPYASKVAIANGFPDNTTTFGLISSIFTLTFSLGNAFGPALSGSLYDAVGFKDATLAIILLSVVGV